ncbi:MAG: polysaccharide deacetylase family protein [Oscillospiraceae bacterium]|jgi:peptidoglycan-N-acetylmuramic acid deacetylase|nr:polysaccharide deacetylase family protein [Oscillospiraceae bacterium]
MKFKFFTFALCTFFLGGSVCANSVSNEKHGYGNGKNTDELNRPTDAVAFNEQYKKYDASSMTDNPDEILLTFDQGYENGYTPKILDTLKEKDVKAIFFLTGSYVKSQPELVQRMIDDGHTIGNHGMTHASFPDIGTEECKNEIMDLHNLVSKQFGYEMRYLRMPCGEYSESSLKTAQELGYKTLFWSFAYVDWITDKQPEPSAAFDTITSSAHGGAIYLLHSVSSTNAEILGSVIDCLRGKGFKV